MHSQHLDSPSPIPAVVNPSTRYRVTMRDSLGQEWSFIEDYDSDARYEARLMEECGSTLISITAICQAPAKSA